jgi:hypothetical protein
MKLCIEIGDTREEMTLHGDTGYGGDKRNCTQRYEMGRHMNLHPDMRMRGRDKSSSA